MAELKQKNLKLDDDALALLAAMEKATGASGAQCVSLTLALYSMTVGNEVKRARQFLFDNLLQVVVTERLHAPLAERRNPKQLIEDLKVRREAAGRTHKVVKGGGGSGKTAQAVKKGTL